jgi:hypothetical protein
MAHFYANIQGTRGEATRCGDKKSGIDGHIRGWNIGARVALRYNSKTDKDECTIYLTSGSNGDKSSIVLGSYTEDDFKKPIEVAMVRPLTQLKAAEEGGR